MNSDAFPLDEELKVVMEEHARVKRENLAGARVIAKQAGVGELYVPYLQYSHAAVHISFSRCADTTSVVVSQSKISLPLPFSIQTGGTYSATPARLSF